MLQLEEMGKWDFIYFWGKLVSGSLSFSLSLSVFPSCETHQWKIPRNLSLIRPISTQMMALSMAE